MNIMTQYNHQNNSTFKSNKQKMQVANNNNLVKRSSKMSMLSANLLLLTTSCFLIALCNLQNQFVNVVDAAGAANSNNNNNGNNNEQASASSQPLWSYHVKPTFSQVNGLNGLNGPGNLLSEAFSGLSQRQGALTTGPLMSILPILLIAAGGIMLLLPFLTMMFASPFGGGLGGLSGFGGANGAGFGAFQQGGQFGGYPQAAAALRAARKRSLTSGGAAAGGDNGSAGSIVWQELLDHVSTTIDELSRKYSPQQAALNAKQQGKSNNLATMTTTASAAKNNNNQQVGVSSTNNKNNLNDVQ